MAGFDTDSNGATVGSVIGMILGVEDLPDKWIIPLNDALSPRVNGFGSAIISGMAERTIKLAEALQAEILQQIGENS